MFISVVIRAEYTPYSYRANFYQQSLIHCRQNGWILITNEYMKSHHQEMQDGISERLLKEFELERLSKEELNEVEQYYIPDKLFEDKEAGFGSRTEMLLYLAKERFTELENCLEGILAQIKEKHPEEKIDGMFYCSETCESFRQVCSKHNIPLIPYLFSAIKMPHGYRQTLYYANMKGFLYNSTENEDRYHEFENENNQIIPIFTNKEIIALIGKERTLPLLQVINHKPKYEMGICGECYAIIPSFFAYNPYTDDDLEGECKALYKDSEMDIRSHALQLDNIRVDRSEMHNDPAPFILSCKRLSSARSQIMLKVMMWARTAVMKKNTHSFGFMCEKDYSSTKLSDLRALNHHIFCYLIPNDLMFSDEYWKWRMSNPSEVDIYQYHLDFYKKKLNLPDEIFTEQNTDKRLELILRSRGCDEEIVSQVMKDDQNYEIDYYAATSKFVYNGKAHWRMNKIVDGKIKSYITISNEGVKDVEFYPMDDVAAFVKLDKLTVNGKTVMEGSDYNYMRKVAGHYTIDLSGIASEYITIESEWNYKKIFEYLNS